MSSEKVRAANLTAAERDLIIEISLKYKNVIENKKTDAVAARDKEVAWKAIAEEFNACCANKRTSVQLKQVSLA